MIIKNSNFTDHGLTREDIVVAAKVLSSIPVGSSIEIPFLQVKRISSEEYKIITEPITTNGESENSFLFEDT